MQPINYNYNECTTNLDLINNVDLWMGPHFGDLMIECGL